MQNFVPSVKKPCKNNKNNGSSSKKCVAEGVVFTRPPTRIGLRDCIFKRNDFKTCASIYAKLKYQMVKN